MKKLAIFIVALFWVVMVGSTSFAQQKSQFLNFEQTKQVVSNLPKTVKDYQALRVRLKGLFTDINKSSFIEDSALSQEALIQLVKAYDEAKEFRGNLIHPLIVFYHLKKDKQYLLVDGWTEQEAEIAKRWSDKFSDSLLKIVKIDNQWPTDEHVKQFILRYNIDYINK